MHMAISEVIKFEGSQDKLVWKYPLEEITATSQLIVDETHEALLVVNGSAADLFSSGRRTLSVPNIPLANKLINIPTGGENPFPCKVFFINKVHQMDMKWGTQTPIALEDPDYQIFMHVMLHGSISVSVDESRKFMLKFVGFRDSFDTETLVSKFRGIISSEVKDSISKIMITGKMGYFKMAQYLSEVSGVVKEKLNEVFDEYGITIRFFNIEAIEVPDKDYAKIAQAKENRAGRIIEGYSWQEEQQMDIAKTFAGNEGTMGSVGGAVGGFMVGSTFGGNIADIARSALSTDRIPGQTPPADLRGVKSPMGGGVEGGFNIGAILKPQPPQEPHPQPVSSHPVEQPIPSQREPEQPAMAQISTCTNCHEPISPLAQFCSQCGQKQVTTCKNALCNAPLKSGVKFCSECGTRVD